MTLLIGSRVNGDARSDGFGFAKYSRADYAVERYEAQVQTDRIPGYTLAANRGYYGDLTEALPTNSSSLGGARMQNDATAGRTIVFSTKAGGSTTWAQVGSGSVDSLIDARGAELATFCAANPNANLIWTFHHEPNGDGTPTDWIAATRRIWDRWLIQGVPVWTGTQSGQTITQGVILAGPNLAMSAYGGDLQTDLEAWYPPTGTSANWTWFWQNVQMICVDAYNTGNVTTGKFRTFAEMVAGIETPEFQEAGNLDKPRFMVFANAKTVIQNAAGRVLLHGVLETGTMNYPEPWVWNGSAWVAGGPHYGSASDYWTAQGLGTPTAAKWYQERADWLVAGNWPHLALMCDYDSGGPRDGGAPWMHDTSQAKWDGYLDGLETLIAGSGWGDSAWGSVHWDGERLGATYLPSGTTTLPAGTTTWTTETVVGFGDTLKFPPNSSATLVMDNKNLIVYGRLEMHPANAAVVHLIQFTNVNEEAYVGGAFPDGTIDTTPQTTDVGLWVVETGVLDAVGTPKAAWNRTGDDPSWLSTDLMKTTPWNVGDYTTYATHTKGGPLATITAGNGVTYTQEAFNLTRNVRFEGTSGKRAHAIIITPNVPQVIKWCSFRHMGPRKLIGALRFPFRHRMGGLHLQHLLDSPDTLIEGVVVFNAGNSAFVCTDSHDVTFRDCIAFDTVFQQYTWAEEWDGHPDENGVIAPGQLSHGVTYDHCMAAAAQVETGEGYGARLDSFRLLAYGGTISNCVAVGNRGHDKASGFYWPEDVGWPWINTDNVAHNNQSSGAYIYQSTSQLNEVVNMVCFRNGGGGMWNGWVNNLHFFGCVGFSNAGGPDFINYCNRDTAAPSYHQVIQDSWFGDVGTNYTHTGSNGNSVYRNNHLGSIRVDELRPNASGFYSRDFDFVENDIQEPEQFCDRAHPHAGDHHLVWMYNTHNPEGIASRYRIQRTDGTAWQIQLEAGSNSDWNPVTIPTFGFAIPTQTLPIALQGQFFSHALTKTFGGSSVTWALAPTSDPLPTGLSLSPIGVISGTPTVGGSFPIDVQATDESTERARQSLTLDVQGDVVMAGWGDGSWGSLHWDGERTGATYLPVTTTTLPAGTTTYTTETVVPYGATLRFPTASTTTLIADNKNLIVYGTLEMKPAHAGITHTLRFTNIDEANFVGGPIGGMSGVPVASDVGLWVVQTGILDAIGTPKASWNRTGDDPSWLPTDDMRKTPWNVGDYTTYATHTKGGALGTVVGPDGVTYKQEAFNITRNVIIEGTPGRRTHVLIRTDAPQTIKWIRLNWVGPRMPVAGPQVSNKIRGRWGLHLHHLGDYGYDTVIEGVAVVNCGSHAFVSHGTHGATFDDCIQFLANETGYWWDFDVVSDRSHDVVYDHCMAAGLTPIPDFVGGSGHSGFLMAQTSGIATDCVAVGNRGNSDESSGFGWPSGSPSGPGASGQWVFEDCIAHNNKGSGLFMWLNPGAVHTQTRFVAFRNNRFGVKAGAYVNQFHYDGFTGFQNAYRDFGVFAVNGTGTSGDLTFRDFFVDTFQFDHHKVGGLFSEPPGLLINSEVGHIWVKDTTTGDINDAGLYDVVYCVKPDGTDIEPADWTVTVMFPTAQYRVQRRNNTAYQVHPNGTTTVIAPFFNSGITGTGDFVADPASFAGTGAESGLGIGVFKPGKPVLAGVGTSQISIIGTGGIAVAAASFQGTGTGSAATSLGHVEGAPASFAGAGVASVNVVQVGGPAFRVGSRRAYSRVRGSLGPRIRGGEGPRERFAFRVRAIRGGGTLRSVQYPSSLRHGSVGEPITSTGDFAASAASFAGLGAAGEAIGTGDFAAAAAELAGVGTGSAITGTGTFTAAKPVLAGTGAESNAAFGSIAASAASFAGVGNSQVTGAGGVAGTAAALAGTGAESITGTSSYLAPAAALQGAGTALIEGVGDLAAAAASFEGTGSFTGVDGTGDLAAAAASLAGSGVYFEQGEGVGFITLAPAELAGVGLVGMVGTGNFAAAPAELSGTSEESVTGTGALTGGAAALAGISVFTIEGTGAVLGAAAALTANGLLNSITGTGALTGAGASFGGTVQIAGNFDYEMSGPYPSWRMSLKTRSG